MKEIPRALILAEQPIVGFYEFHISLLIGVDAGFVLSSSFISFETCSLHPALLDQSLSAIGIDAAPYAAGLAWRKADSVADFIDPLADTIDPAEAKSLIDRLRPADARLARVFLVKAD